MDLGSKFDVEKKILPIIYTCNESSKIRDLRLKNKTTLKELSKEINISITTLRHIEIGKIQVPYYYWKIICNHFNIDHVQYLSLYNMKELSVLDKLIKIRAYLGARTWGEVGVYLGYSQSFISDIFTRYTPNETHCKYIDYALEKLK